MRLVVSDTGPILHLHESRNLHLLELPGQVVVPPEVETELLHLIPSWRAIQPAWLDSGELSEDARLEAQAWSEARLLDPGEAQAVALARQLGAEWLLTDDAAARLLAIRLGLEVHGSLGIVLWAAAAGHLGLDEARAHLEALFQSSLWVSPRVQSEALGALGALFEG